MSEACELLPHDRCCKTSDTEVRCAGFILETQEHLAESAQADDLEHQPCMVLICWN